MRISQWKSAPWAVVALVIVAAGASGALFAVRSSGDEATRAVVAQSTPAAVRPTPTPSVQASPPHPVSLQALMQKKLTGRAFKVGQVLARAGAYTRYFISYESSGLTISGIMNVPRGKGPFPILILNHGYIDPDIYTNGRGLKREQDYLARRGYVVVHPDYRGHAQSDDDPNSDMRLRLGYTEDVLNAIVALRGSKLPYVDASRVGMLGRSMGGGVTLNAAVVRPDLIDAVVLFAPVSSNTVDNFNRWFRRGSERRALAQRIVDRYGSPADNPVFWRNVSAVNFLDRIAVPIVIHHGTSDESVPYPWSKRTLAALQKKGKRAVLFTYEGEQHAFGPQWPASMRRTVDFFDARV